MAQHLAAAAPTHGLAAAIFRHSEVITGAAATLSVELVKAIPAKLDTEPVKIGLSQSGRHRASFRGAGLCNCASIPYMNAAGPPQPGAGTTLSPDDDGEPDALALLRGAHDGLD